MLHNLISPSSDGSRVRKYPPVDDGQAAQHDQRSSYQVTPRNDASALAAGVQALSIQPVGSYEGDAQHYTTVQPGGYSTGTHSSLQASTEPRVDQHGTTYKFNQRRKARDRPGLNAGPLYMELPAHQTQRHPWLERSRLTLTYIPRAQAPPLRAPEPKCTTRTAITNAIMNQRVQVEQVTNSMIT